MQRREFWRAQIRLGHIATDRLAAPYPNLKLRETAAHPPVPHAPPPPPAQLTADEKIAQLEKEISNLHETLTRKAVNSRNTTDVFGRTFVLPVDEEHKAKVCGAGQLCSCALPHMRAFWCSTISFFSTFFSVFAPAAIMPYLKRTPERGGLGLTRTHIAVSGSCAIALTIVGRVVAGPLCDLIGARRTCMLLLLDGRSLGI